MGRARVPAASLPHDAMRRAWGGVGQGASGSSYTRFRIPQERLPVDGRKAVALLTGQAQTSPDEPDAPKTDDGVVV